MTDDPTLTPEMKAAFQRYLQASYDRNIWEGLKDRVEKYRPGSWDSNMEQFMARRLGLDLEAPAFLERLLEMLEEVAPPDPHAAAPTPSPAPSSEGE